MSPDLVGTWPYSSNKGHRGCDCMVVGFTTACAISAITTKVVNLNSAHGEV